VKEEKKIIFIFSFTQFKILYLPVTDPDWCRYDPSLWFTSLIIILQIQTKASWLCSVKSFFAFLQNVGH